ncbi:MAG: MFS transporter [Planctomycetota bacterium]
MLARLLQDARLFAPAVRRYLVGSALMGMAYAVPWTLLNLYLDQLGLSKAEIGSVNSAEAWGRALVAVPAAFLLASRRTIPVLVATSLLGAVAYAALPWMSGVPLIAAVNLVRGFSDQVHHVAIAPFLFRHTRSTERATAFAVAEAVHTLMAVAGSFGSGRLVTWLADAAGGEASSMAWVLAGTALLPLLAAPAFAGIREETRAPEERPPVLATVRAHRGLLLRFAVPQFLIACGAGLVIPFLGLYFTDRFGFRPGSVGNLFACGQVLMTTGFLLSPEILRRLGYVRGVVFVEVLSIPFFLILAFSFHLPLAIFAFLLRGALMNTAHPILKNLMMRASPEGMREVQNGMLGLLWGVAWILGPVVGGAILDRTDNSYTVLMCTTVTLYLAASLSSYLLLSPVERRLAPE